MDDGRSQILLGSVVGGRDARAVEKDEQAGAMLLIPGLQAAGGGRVRLLGEEGPEDEPVDGVLNAAAQRSSRCVGHYPPRGHLLGAPRPGALRERRCHAATRTAAP